ncbi:P-loop NTPase family protein [Fuscibacter oryzae]|uniref:Chromosomal replication initiator DnaA n=1 Tax=Fuscibacter oryzae TaxID=2803939 RepID=A0A8J7STF1_9RHOB|nr:DnaA/Hda family protein [Fuscibacter oryzae]MBL4926506.1 chromosomal replication initiator DnaA [Fuscibacter oryzae]
MAFDLGHGESYDRAGFFPSPANAGALAMIGDDAAWPGGKLLLVGPEGAGKTHLAHIWALNGGRIVASHDLPGLDLRSLGPRVAVEDAELIGGNRAAEEALFHLHNLILSAAQPSGRLLITARTAPRDWNLHLPDLLSRMQATAIARLAPPDDALLAAVLVKLFADRQISVPPNLIPYLVARMERSIAAARNLVAQLDRLALAEGRGVTRQLAAEILDSAGRE